MSANSCQPFPSFVELAECRYGYMLYPMADQYVGGSFQAYGEFSDGEVEAFRHLVQRGSVVLDIGANIGAHTVPLAQLTGPTGIVIAFEPQPILHQMLCANLALNSVPNALTHGVALSDQPGTCRIPILNYGKPFNFGGVSMDMVSEGESVPVSTLDRFQFQRVDFIKLDVEGFESKVLDGAAETLKRCRPALYVENDRPEKSPRLIQQLMDLGYRLWWHSTPLYRPDNFRDNPENVFGDLASLNMIAVPGDRACPLQGLRAVKGPQDWWV